MIGYLTGKIISLIPSRLLIDVNGVGYIVHISLNTYEKLNSKENPVSVYTYLSVKQDSLDLFGFFTQTEKDMFELLISINGIGPKLALGVLSGIQTDDLKNAIQFGDAARIKAIPGIGKKTADRLILELKDKMGLIADDISTTTSTKAYTVKNDAVSALNMLGYSPKVSEKIIKQIIDEKPAISLEDLIKSALIQLNK
ncbi:MAG: Holliday junction branch migration protein RuvA [bacterium]